MNLKEVRELIELVSQKGFAEFEIERQGFRLRLVRFNPNSPGPAPVQQKESRRDLDSQETVQPAVITPEVPAPAPPQEKPLHTIKALMPGTFYQASSPTAEPFVKIGDRVEPDTVVCIIEAMKLMNEITAEVSGEVAETYVENGQPVEYGEPLFGIRL
jgi:acetyl-CoA carboxylase biotin carboxyl carrier protein